MQLFSADTTKFFEKKIAFILPLKTWKNHPQKLLIIGPDIFFQLPISQNLAQISTPVP